ncbi:MAG TPA: type II toxin-antitoxin system VapC family toxin [Streptosporangiales bacterium]
MIVLDTNVLSEMVRPNPASAVVEWLDVQPASGLATTSITAAELFAGVARLPDGRRRARLTDEIAASLADLRGPLLPFDIDAAWEYAEVVASRTRMGRCIEIADAQIAAVCRVRGATLATRNVKDFEGVGVEVVNPWTVDLDVDER